MPLESIQDYMNRQAAPAPEASELHRLLAADREREHAEYQRQAMAEVSAVDSAISLRALQKQMDQLQAAVDEERKLQEYRSVQSTKLSRISIALSVAAALFGAIAAVTAVIGLFL